MLMSSSSAAARQSDARVLCRLARLIVPTSAFAAALAYSCARHACTPQISPCFSILRLRQRSPLSVGDVYWPEKEEVGVGMVGMRTGMLNAGVMVVRVGGSVDA